jgi:hypothetical protein
MPAMHSSTGIVRMAALLLCNLAVTNIMDGCLKQTAPSICLVLHCKTSFMSGLLTCHRLPGSRIVDKIAMYLKNEIPADESHHFFVISPRLDAE